MAKTKIHHLDLNQLSNAEYLCFAQQVADLISSAKALHVAESVVTNYKANIANMAGATSPLPENDYIAIRTEMIDQYEDITATVDAFSVLQPSQEITDFISRLNKLLDRTRKVYRQCINRKNVD